MNCKNCNNETNHKIGKIINGSYIEHCPRCSSLSEISGKIDYASPKTKQHRNWQREKYAGDIEQPFEMRKGEVRKGWQANNEFIKTYKNEPNKLSPFTKKQLKESGVVTKETAAKSAAKAN